MDIEYTTTISMTKENLKPGDIFTRSCDCYNKEIFLTIYIEDKFYFVRLSDAKVFDEHLLSLDEKLFKHHCKLTVEV